ncbi:MAG: ABC transporter substrate-binding protein [Pseudomonadota bacterium]
MALTKCGGAPDEKTRVLRHSFDEAPRTLDPLRASTVYTNFVLLNAYDTLYAYKYLARPYELKPNLASAMPTVSADGLTLTIPLKPDVFFADDPAFANGKGREVTAHDVVYSIRRHFDATNLSQGAWLWRDRIVGLDQWGRDGADENADIAGLRALDDHTLQITLTGPFPQIVHTLAQGFSVVVPREAVDTYGQELAVRTVGSGPYRVTAFDSTSVTLERNPRFRSEPVDLDYEGYDAEEHAGYNLDRIDGRSPPFVDRIEIDFIPEDASRMTSLTKGDEVQVARVPAPLYENYLSSKVPPSLKPAYAQDYNVLGVLEPGFLYHSFNLAHPDFGYSDDPEQDQRNRALRCAIIKGFDWPTRNERFYAGVGQVFPGAIVPVSPEYRADADQTSITHDPEGARRLLAENGWTADTLPPLVYAVSASVRQQQLFEQFRGFMQAIGYPREKIRLKQYATFGDLAEAWKLSELPLINKGWTLDYPDLENIFQLFYGPNQAPGSNEANYQNPEFDALYRQASVMPPGPERTALYHRMNQMTIDDCVSISGLSRSIIFMWHRDVIAYPDRNIVGGHWTRYADLID